MMQAKEEGRGRRRQAQVKEEKRLFGRKELRVQYTKEDFYNKLSSIQNENKLTDFDDNENSQTDKKGV